MTEPMEERAIKAAAKAMGASEADLRSYTEGILEGCAAHVSELREELERHCACEWERHTTGEEGPRVLCPYHADQLAARVDAEREVERKNTALRQIERHPTTQWKVRQIAQTALTDPEPADQPSDSREGDDG